MRREGPKRDGSSALAKVLGQPVGHQRPRSEDAVGTSVVAPLERGQFRTRYFGVDALGVAEENNRIASAMHDEQWTAHILGNAFQGHSARALPPLSLVRRARPPGEGGACHRWAFIPMLSHRV